jgi:hypothetical protein
MTYHKKKKKKTYTINQIINNNSNLLFYSSTSKANLCLSTSKDQWQILISFDGQRSLANKAGFNAAGRLSSKEFSTSID